MKKYMRGLAVFAILTGLLAACNFPLSSSQSEEDAVATSVALTVAAVEASVQQQPTEVVILPTNTVSSLPTITPQVINTVSYVPTSTPIYNQAALTSEDPDDGEIFSPGEAFTKTWRIKNIGTSTWTTSYRMAFISGNSMSGTSSIYLTDSVAPGETIDVSVNLTAPSSAGTYTGTWNLKDADGNNFANFWVQIVVEDTTFAVTGVTLSAEHTNIEGTCPQTFNYQAVVTANGAGTVTYYFTYSDGTTGATKSMSYSAAGSKTLSGSWELNATGDYWVKIYIDSPNHQFFGPLNLTLTCTP